MTTPPRVPDGLAAEPLPGAGLARHAYLEAILTETLACASAAEVAGATARVPACPEWDVAALVAHLVSVQRSWTAMVRDRRQEPPTERPEQVSGGFAEALDALRQSGRALADALAAADPAERVWTWSHQQDVAFVLRHQAQEAAVHRYDAQAAAGEAHPIAAPLAADAVDEFLHHMAAEARSSAAPVGGTVHLHATDAEGEWLASETDDRSLVVRREHTKGDAALRGPSSDLLLVLYRRLDLDTLEVLGDRGVAERFVARTATD